MHLCTWQGLNISPPYMSASRQPCIVWEEILERHMANGWCRHHLQSSYRGPKAFCGCLEGQRRLWFEERVTKWPVAERLHRVTPVWLALALYQKLHMLRQASAGLGLYFHVHSRGDRYVF